MLNIDSLRPEEEVEKEVCRVIEQYTRQAKNSGWGVREARELVVSGYAGWIRKKRKRRENGEDLYRSAAASLPARVRGKLTGKETWFKEKKRREKDEFDQEGKDQKPRKRRKLDKEEEIKVIVIGER